jgi:hypothetical protein
MIGIQLSSAATGQWALVTASAKKPGSYQCTFGDARGPSGDSIRDTPHEALALALDEGLTVDVVRGGRAAAKVVREVEGYREAMRSWVAKVDAGDYDAEPPKTPAWAGRSALAKKAERTRKRQAAKRLRGRQARRLRARRR